MLTSPLRLLPLPLVSPPLVIWVASLRRRPRWRLRPGRQQRLGMGGMGRQRSRRIPRCLPAGRRQWAN